MQYLLNLQLFSNTYKKEKEKKDNKQKIQISMLNVSKYKQQNVNKS